MELKLSNISKVYKDKKAVDCVNLTFTNGVTALLGANGSGKTTLMRMLATVLTPSEGEIDFDGRDIRILDADYRNLLGYLPQNFGYYKDFSAYDFLIYMCALKGIDGQLAEEKSLQMLDFVDLTSVKNKKLKTFSGGMRQRLGIAQALLNDPQILILDEPTAGLDPKERIRFRNLMVETSKERIIIYATHIVSDISFLADRVLIMKEGKIAADNNIKNMLSELDGKVWSVDVDHSKSEFYQLHFSVGEINQLENGLIRMRVISDFIPSENAKLQEPSLDDVYLYYFGSTSDENER